VARPNGYAPPVNGDEIRDTWFLDGGSWWGSGACDGYLASEVDDVLRRVAAELDAGRPAGPLIENAMFRLGKGRRAYNTDAVDWFLDQLLLSQDRFGPAGATTDPWRDVGDVTQLVLGRVSGLAGRYSPPHKPTPRKAWRWFAGQCENAWRDFGQQPGVQLRWEQVQLGAERWELRTTAQQTLASLDFWGPVRTMLWWSDQPKTVSAGGRRFTFQEMDRARSSSPVIAEIADRDARDGVGHFAEPIHSRRLPSVTGLVDEGGTPILYTSGTNFSWRACFCVTFPDGRWLRFLVRGTKEANAIMTAVDQAGNKVARYRIIDSGLEITVNPGQKLTDELALAIAIPARSQLRTYSLMPNG
jgi:hypothetical protein